MDKRPLLAFLLFFVFAFQWISGAETVWLEQNFGLGDTDIRSISVFPGDENLICASSAKRVYLSKNGGVLWKEIFSVATENVEINFVAFDRFEPKVIFLATTKGLYATQNQGESWYRTFRKVNKQAKSVNWISFDPLDSQKVYIGTGAGLYFSKDKGESWRKSGIGLPRSPVRAVVVHPHNSRVLYLANDYGLFKSIDAAGCWRRVYVTSHSLGDDEDEEGEEDSLQTDENSNLINCIAIDKTKNKEIFIATGEGVIASYDAGGTWGKLSSQGLSCDDVNFIVVSANKNNSLYAATKAGVFKFSHNLNNWHQIYQGMTGGEVRALALNAGTKQLFAGTDKGVFKTVEINSSQKQAKEVLMDKSEEIGVEQALKKVYLNEPTIQEVQEAALRYARVIHPQEIQRLRRNAKLKALLPDVSVDYDKTISYSKDNFWIGPYDWGLSLSWDVGDLVFSEQIRLIDSGTRLLVQLRDDILDEVTRLYYERRRLQTEFILDPPGDSAEKLTRTLRLEELTANIDGLTGGYFSRQVKR